MSMHPTFPLTHARFAGLLYLAIIVLGVWAEMVVRASLIVPGDAAATASNILASEGLFRLSFAADTVMVMADVALATLLYVLLRPVNATLALAAMIFRLVQAVLIAMNLLNQNAVLLVLNGTAQMTGFDAEQLNALALLSAQTQGNGYDLGLIFFGINSLLIGALVFRSSYFPRLIGLMMIGSGVVYLVGSYTVFLAPAYAAAFEPAYLVPLVSESAFALYLLIRGINVRSWTGNVLAVEG